MINNTSSVNKNIKCNGERDEEDASHDLGSKGVHMMGRGYWLLGSTQCNVQEWSVVHEEEYPCYPYLQMLEANKEEEYLLSAW